MQSKIKLFLSSVIIFTVNFAEADQAETIDRILIDEKAAEGNQIEESYSQTIQEAEKTPGGVTVIDIEEVTEGKVSNLSDVLRYVPGVWSVSTSGSDGIYFTSRGSNLDATDFDMNGIKLLQDGLPVTTAAGDNHNRIIDPLSADYAVVARGANALKYGASTLGGAINFVSPTAYTTSPLELYFNTGSFGQLNGRATVSTVTESGFDALVTLEGKHWDGYRDHNDQERAGLYSNFGWKLNDQVVTRFYATYIDNDQELATGLSQVQVDEDRDQAGPRAENGDFQLNVRTWRVANKTSWKIDDSRRFEFGLSYEDQSLFHPIVDKVFVDFDGPGPMAPTEVFGGLLIDTDHKDIGATMRYNQQAGAHDFLIGINAGKNTQKGSQFGNDGGERDGEMTEVDNDAYTVEAFLLDRWQLNERWTLVGGVQGVLARREVELSDPVTGMVTRNPKENYSQINPTLGLIYDLNQTSSLYANVSRLFEPPTNFELEDEVSGGDEPLDAMQGTVLEVGTRGTQSLSNSNWWQWELSLFYSWIQDEILSTEDPMSPGDFLATNIDDTTHAGIEALVRSEWSLGQEGRHWLAPVVSFTLNKFEFDNDETWGNNDLPAAPDYVVRGELLYRNSNGFYFGPTFDFVGERYADFANSYEIDSYEIFGLKAGWSNEKVKLFAEVRNLFDKEYIVRHSIRERASVTDEILNPGEPLAAYVGLQVRM